MDQQKLLQMIAFHGNAAKATYAGSSGQTTSQRQDFIELEYKEGDFYYRDSYTGFLRSWGQEVIYLNDNAVWTNIYGGGMESEYMSHDFALQTFAFLKTALSSKVKDAFYPRGPDSFHQEKWNYNCAWQGNLTDFSGSEFITYEDKTVFRHQFIGGLIIGKE